MLIFKLKNVGSVLEAFLKAKFFEVRIPLIVTWALTYRCNNKCRYCGLSTNIMKELNLSQILSIIDELAKVQCRVISFSGGEPLLREDIGKIIEHTVKKNIFPKVNSNGGLLPQKIKKLRYLSMLNLSLDGPEDIHNYLRGAGSYEKVMEAISIAKSNNIKVTICTVLSRYNLNYIDFILEKAKEFNTKVMFQPATQQLLGTGEINPVSSLGEKYRQVIRQLYNEKKRGNKNINNSLAGLKHLYNWPNPIKIKCASGLISCHIEPNGDLFLCSRTKDKIRPLNCLNNGLKSAFEILPTGIICENCWCASIVELNKIFSLSPNAFFNAINLMT